jgi:hypothetical protein
MSLKQILTGAAIACSTFAASQNFYYVDQEPEEKTPRIGFATLEGTATENSDFLVPRVNIQAWGVQPIVRQFSLYIEQDVVASYQPLGSFYNSQSSAGLGFATKEDSLYVVFAALGGYNRTNREDKATAGFTMRVQRSWENWGGYFRVAAYASKMKAEEQFGGTEMHTLQELMINYKDIYLHAEFDQISLGPMRKDNIMKTVRLLLSRDMLPSNPQQVRLVLSYEFNNQVENEREVVGNRPPDQIQLSILYSIGDFPKHTKRK